MCSSSLHYLHLGIHRSLNRSSRSPTNARISRSGSKIKFHGSAISSKQRRSAQRRAPRPISAMDDDFMDDSFVFDEGEGSAGMDSYHVMYSSGEDSDTDATMSTSGDYDLPLSKGHRLETPEAALNLTVHRFGAIQRGQRKRRRR